MSYGPMTGDHTYLVRVLDISGLAICLCFLPLLPALFKLLAHKRTQCRRSCCQRRVAWPRRVCWDLPKKDLSASSRGISTSLSAPATSFLVAFHRRHRPVWCHSSAEICWKQWHQWHQWHQWPRHIEDLTPSILWFLSTFQWCEMWPAG